ncbi:DsrE family protein [Thiothrix lacustris]|uniref:DsrE family protein n=1 Tax=Thiothrix lacustris TaxID=525917 RepID=UPI0027E4B26D|nr:DsrE family protein [Thiothrix lacustris]WMP16649.1 DsrE family protein [Thiothrix lacustris]
MTLTPRLPAAVLAVSLLFNLPLATAVAPATTASDTATAAEQTHRLVIQVNKREEDYQDHILSNIVNLQKHYGMDNIEIEVVAYGPGIWLVTDKSAFLKRVESLMMQNVTFTACGNTLDTVAESSGTRPALIDGIEETQTGIARIIALQEQGWSYLSP